MPMVISFTLLPNEHGFVEVVSPCLCTPGLLRMMVCPHERLNLGHLKRRGPCCLKDLRVPEVRVVDGTRFLELNPEHVELT